jgi:hypothetical protein
MALSDGFKKLTVPFVTHSSKAMLHIFVASEFLARC